MAAGGGSDDDVRFPPPVPREIGDRGPLICRSPPRRIPLLRAREIWLLSRWLHCVPADSLAASASQAGRRGVFSLANCPPHPVTTTVVFNVVFALCAAAVVVVAAGTAAIVVAADGSSRCDRRRVQSRLWPLCCAVCACVCDVSRGSSIFWQCVTMNSRGRGV